VQLVGHEQRPHRRVQAVGADHHLTVVGESVPAGDGHPATEVGDRGHVLGGLQDQGRLLAAVAQDHLEQVAAVQDDVGGAIELLSRFRSSVVSCCPVRAFMATSRQGLGAISMTSSKRPYSRSNRVALGANCRPTPRGLYLCVTNGSSLLPC